MSGAYPSQRHTAGFGYTSAQHSFAEIPRAEIPRSVFDRSCSLKTAFDSGYLIPIFVDEALPGDTFQMRCSSFCRMTTPLYPIMDNVYMDYFFFAVPYRLIWENWEKFNGAQENPGDSTVFVCPTVTHTPVVNDLYDYMGLVGATYAVPVTANAFATRSYNLIWNEWFRDENLQNSAVVDVDNGPDTDTDYFLRRRGKRHDYFTSCLPFVQKGTAVSLPLGTTAPILASGDIAIVSAGTGIPSFVTSGGVQNLQEQGVAAPNLARFAGAGSAAGDVTWSTPNLRAVEATLESTLTANLAAATAASINQIREAFQVQRLLERDARGGTRYTEIVRAHFGVISPDQRLQRPEYLGGGSTRVNIHPVARTTGPTSGAGVAPYATLGAFATTSAERVGFLKSFTEHCLILGLVQVRADLTYQQGVERMFHRSTRYEYYWPAFAHLGEQAVLNREIYYQNTAADTTVFGYQERYAEYRYKPSRTSGTMRSNGAAPIDQWHLGIEFGALPVLGDTFIQDNSPFDRVVAVTTEPEFFGDFWFEYRCARPMPTFSVPGLVDHF